MLKHVPRTDVIKVGVRKIDSIIIDPITSYRDACSIFNPAIFAILRSGLIKDDALKVHEEVSIIEKEQHLCIIRAQMQKAPMPTGCQASLDFDLVDRRPIDFKSAFSVSLPELNNRHYDLFMWAASDELIKLMGG